MNLPFIMYLPMVSMLFFIFLDFIIKEKYLGTRIYKTYMKFLNLDYLTVVIILFIIVFSLFMLLSYFNILYIESYYLNNKNIYLLLDNVNEATNAESSIANSGINNTNNVNADATVNINHPRLTVNFPASALNNVAAAVSVAGGGGLALKVMQQIPGGPGTKAVAGAAVMLTTQALTCGMVKILNMNESSSKTKKFVEYINNSNYNFINGETKCNAVNIINHINDNKNDIPLNLLPEINQLVTAELMFLFIILNIFIVRYISTLNYNEYLPNKKIGNILKFLINRYLTIWSKSITLLLIVS